MKKMRGWGPLAVILAAFAVFTTLFINATPYRTSGVLQHQINLETRQRQEIPDVGAPDERQHANYIRDLMQGKGLPVLKPGDPDLGETYQSHQPPAYYFLATAFAKATGSNVEESSGKNIRFLSLLLGLGTITGIYFFVLWALNRQDAALAAASFCLMPMFVALHGAISNDPLLFLCCTWTLALLMRMMRFGVNFKMAALIGGIIGLGICTKTSAIGLFPIALVAALILVKVRPEDKQRILPTGLIIFIISVLIALPVWIRNQSLYGDPLAMKAFTAAFVGSPAAQTYIDGLGLFGYLHWVSWWTSRSFVGVFGYMDIFLFQDQLRSEKSGSIYLAIIFLLLIAVVVGVVRLGSKQATPQEDEEVVYSKPLLILCATAFVVYLVLFLQFNLTYFQGQARYLYPAFAASAALMGVGVTGLSRRLGEWAWLVPFIGLILLDIVSLQQIQSGFALRAGMGL